MMYNRDYQEAKVLIICRTPDKSYMLVLFPFASICVWDKGGQRCTSSWEVYIMPAVNKWSSISIVQGTSHWERTPNVSIVNQDLTTFSWQTTKKDGWHLLLMFGVLCLWAVTCKDLIISSAWCKHVFICLVVDMERNVHGNWHGEECPWQLAWRGMPMATGMEKHGSC